MILKLVGCLEHRLNLLMAHSVLIEGKLWSVFKFRSDLFFGCHSVVASPYFITLHIT